MGCRQGLIIYNWFKISKKSLNKNFVGTTLKLFFYVVFIIRSYLLGYTGSHLNSEVKQCKAWSVLGWGTAWEALQVLLALFPDSFFLTASAEGSQHKNTLPPHYTMLHYTILHNATQCHTMLYCTTLHYATLRY